MTNLSLNMREVYAQGFVSQVWRVSFWAGDRIPGNGLAEDEYFHAPGAGLAAAEEAPQNSTDPFDAPFALSGVNRPIEGRLGPDWGET